MPRSKKRSGGIAPKSSGQRDVDHSNRGDHKVNLTDKRGKGKGYEVSPNNTTATKANLSKSDEGGQGASPLGLPSSPLSALFRSEVAADVATSDIDESKRQQIERNLFDILKIDRPKQTSDEVPQHNTTSISNVEPDNKDELEEPIPEWALDDTADDWHVEDIPTSLKDFQPLPDQSLFAEKLPGLKKDWDVFHPFDSTTDKWRNRLVELCADQDSDERDDGKQPLFSRSPIGKISASPYGNMLDHSGDTSFGDSLPLYLNELFDTPDSCQETHCMSSRDNSLNTSERTNIALIEDLMAEANAQDVTPNGAAGIHPPNDDLCERNAITGQTIVNNSASLSEENDMTTFREGGDIMKKVKTPSSSLFSEENEFASCPSNDSKSVEVASNAANESGSDTKLIDVNQSLSNNLSPHSTVIDTKTSAEKAVNLAPTSGSTQGTNQLKSTEVTSEAQKEVPATKSQQAVTSSSNKKELQSSGMVDTPNSSKRSKKSRSKDARWIREHVIGEIILDKVALEVQKHTPFTLVGRVVTLKGLISKPHLNGSLAHVVAYRESGRYSVNVEGSKGTIDVRVINMCLETDLDWSEEVFHEPEDCILLPPSVCLTIDDESVHPTIVPSSIKQACLEKLQGAIKDMQIPPESQECALNEMMQVLFKWSKPHLFEKLSADEVAINTNHNNSTTTPTTTNNNNNNNNTGPSHVVMVHRKEDQPLNRSPSTPNQLDKVAEPTVTLRQEEKKESIVSNDILEDVITPKSRDKTPEIISKTSKLEQASSPKLSFESNIGVQSLPVEESPKHAVFRDFEKEFDKEISVPYKVQQMLQERFLGSSASNLDPARELSQILGMAEEDCRLALAFNGDPISAANFLLHQPSFSLQDVDSSSDDLSPKYKDKSGKEIQKSKSDYSQGDVVVLADPRDISFARVMQRCDVAGTTLPSGLYIPEQGKWVIEGRAVIRFPEESDVKESDFFNFRTMDNGKYTQDDNEAHLGGNRSVSVKGKISPQIDFMGLPKKKSLTAPLYLPQVDDSEDEEDTKGDFPIKYESSLPICHPPPPSLSTNQAAEKHHSLSSTELDGYGTTADEEEDDDWLTPPRSFDPDAYALDEVCPDSPPPLEGVSPLLSSPIIAKTSTQDDDKHLFVSEANMLDKVMGFDDEYDPKGDAKRKSPQPNHEKEAKEDVLFGMRTFSREFSPTQTFTGSFTDCLPGAPTPSMMAEHPFHALTKEAELVETLMNLGIGRFAAERLVEDLGVRELGDFRFLRSDELAAVLEADGLDDFYDDDYDDDDDDDDDEYTQSIAEKSVGKGVTDKWSLEALESNQCAVQLAIVKQALLRNGIVLGEAGPPHPNPDLVLNCRRSLSQETQSVGFEATLKRVSELKEQGNDLMAKNMFVEAREEYSEAVDLGTDRILNNQQHMNGSGDNDELEHLMAMCLANRSLASLKLDEPKTALWDAVQAERLWGEYGKAALRRGAAREALEQYSLAIEAYERAASLDEGLVKAVSAAKSRCQAKLGERLDEKGLTAPDD